MAQTNNDSRFPTVKLAFLPLIEQLNLMERALNSNTLTFAKAYANAFMVVFVVRFRTMDAVDNLDDYWYVRSARTPKELRLAVETMTCGARDVCRLLEMVESCVSATLCDLPLNKQVECELSEAYSHTAESLKRDVALGFLIDLEVAARVIGIDEIRVISNSLLSSLEKIYSL